MTDSSETVTVFMMTAYLYMYFCCQKPRPYVTVMEYNIYILLWTLVPLGFNLTQIFRMI